MRFSRDGVKLNQVEFFSIFHLKSVNFYAIPSYFNKNTSTLFVTDVMDKFTCGEDVCLFICVNTNRWAFKSSNSLYTLFQNLLKNKSRDKVIKRTDPMLSTYKLTLTFKYTERVYTTILSILCVSVVSSFIGRFLHFYTSYLGTFF